MSHLVGDGFAGANKTRVEYKRGLVGSADIIEYANSLAWAGSAKVSIYKRWPVRSIQAVRSCRKVRANFAGLSLYQAATSGSFAPRRPIAVSPLLRSGNENCGKFACPTACPGTVAGGTAAAAAVNSANIKPNVCVLFIMKQFHVDHYLTAIGVSQA